MNGIVKMNRYRTGTRSAEDVDSDLNPDVDPDVDSDVDPDLCFSVEVT